MPYLAALPTLSDAEASESKENRVSPSPSLSPTLTSVSFHPSSCTPSTPQLCFLQSPLPLLTTVSCHASSCLCHHPSHPSPLFLAIPLLVSAKASDEHVVSFLRFRCQVFIEGSNSRIFTAKTSIFSICRRSGFLEYLRESAGETKFDDTFQKARYLPFFMFEGHCTILTASFFSLYVRLYLCVLLSVFFLSLFTLSYSLFLPHCESCKRFT